MSHSMDAIRRVISSPCIGICSLDRAGRCRGCLRTREEIARWRDTATPACHPLMQLADGPIADWERP